MLALVVDTSLSGMQVARELDRLVTDRGRPRMIVSDNGSEFTSNAILTWADQRKNSLSGSRASWVLEPSLAGCPYVLARLLGGVDCPFLRVMPRRAKKRDRLLVLVCRPRSAKASRSSRRKIASRAS